MGGADMKILNKIMTQNPCYKEGKRQKTKGLMLHSVGVNQPNAEVFYNNWNKSSYTRACVHAFIDANTGEIWQTLPWANYGWHGGTKEANSYYIGVEMCESAYIKYTGSGAQFTVTNKTKAKADAKRTYKAAVELFAKLCEDFKLDPSSIISHNEGRLKGIASAHYDPEHYWNGLGLSYTMDTFRKAVKSQMAKNKKFTAYMVKVTDPSLNIRKGPGTNYAIQKAITDMGTYTIVDESDGQGATRWGLLKSYSTNRNGWISLDYTKKV